MKGLKDENQQSDPGRNQSSVIGNPGHRRLRHGDHRRTHLADSRRGERQAGGARQSAGRGGQVELVATNQVEFFNPQPNQLGVPLS